MGNLDPPQPGFRPGEYGRPRHETGYPNGQPIHGHREPGPQYRPMPGSEYRPMPGSEYRPMPGSEYRPMPPQDQPARPSYGQPSRYPAPARQPFPAGHPFASGPPFSAGPSAPSGPANPPVPAGGPPASDHARARWRTVAMLMALVLLAVLGWQAYQIQRLSSQVREADGRLDRAAADTRVDEIDKRVGTLERKAGAAFNPEVISAAVLPSVFRVTAGPVTGTAFAVGRPASGGGTNLLTNWHVVEAAWNTGDRRVFLERTGQRFPATIVKVDKKHDVAHLKADARFTGLATAPTPAKPGQQIVVVGAPLGLEDSVTTGVVSAQRTLPDLAGPVIQFDAPINPGNSGGPVVNGAKQVVGIATAKQRNAEGIGLAVPIKTACGAIPIC